MSNPDVLIVGAGLAGLCCALRLHQSGISSLVLEASDGVAGRVRTDRVDGFLLDRGFQVLLTAYPEARRVLDYDALDLRPFYPGSLIHYGGRFYRFADPWRRPLDSFSGLFSPIGTFSDKLRISKLRRKVLSCSLDEIYQHPETTTLEALRSIGFSENMIDRFFRPFIGGVFFDWHLEVSSRMFEFGFRMFALGDTALPSKGMGSIPEQIAAQLPEATIRTGNRVESLREGGVTVASGEQISAPVVVIATHGPEADRLLGEGKQPGSRSVTCLYFSADEPPLSEPILVLNGEGKGFVTSLCSPSLVSPSYAPKGKILLQATILGNPSLSDEELRTAVVTQLDEWFGPKVNHWKLLRIYRIPHALPMQLAPVPNPALNPSQVNSSLFLCGEHRSVASIQWAMVSGRGAAEAVIKKLGK